MPKPAPILLPKIVKRSENNVARILYIHTSLPLKMSLFTLVIRNAGTYNTNPVGKRKRRENPCYCKKFRVCESEHAKRLHEGPIQARYNLESRGGYSVRSLHIA